MDLKKLLKEEIFFKIISFFNDNPASIDTPRGVAAWTQETRQDTKRALVKLSQLKILTPHKVSSTTAYSFTRDSRLIGRIKKEFRLLKKERGDVYEKQ